MGCILLVHWFDWYCWLQGKWGCILLVHWYDWYQVNNTSNANMADHSVVARDELHESAVSQSSMFCFDNAYPENSCFVVELFCFVSL